MTWTAPSFVTRGSGSSAKHNVEVIDNLIHLKQEDDRRGIVGRQGLVANSVGYTASGNSDFVLSGVDTFAGRRYVVRLHTNATTSAAGRWIAELTVNAVVTDRLVDIDTPSGFGFSYVGSCLWTPGTLVGATIRVAHVEISGTSTLTYVGTATDPRSLSIEDVGPS